jgi:hypothetical protein
VSESALKIVDTASPWIGVAVLDWQSPHLRSFYPTDVPQEWQLTWYANFCMAVVISPTRWLRADAALVAQWCEQTHENFWFYMLCETSEQVNQALHLSPSFNGKLGGLILAADVPTVELISIPVLQFGLSALRCDDANLRATHKTIATWLASFSAIHGLVVLEGPITGKIKEVQTLLELMGALS